ncbi:hypothetical protein [Acidovorax sp. KKS102]|nr:hypothetical protein [Acidovorax sp. KKS102]
MTAPSAAPSAPTSPTTTGVDDGSSDPAVTSQVAADASHTPAAD